MGKILSILVLLLGLSGASAVALLGRREPTSGAAREVVASIDAALTQTAAGVHARVTTLAELPRLVAAVSTDAATVADLTQSELAFRARPNEIIEIGQISLGSGAATSLLRIPADGPAAALPKPGVQLTASAGQLLLTEVVHFSPSERDDGLKGAIGVSAPVDLMQVKTRLDALAWTGQLKANGVVLPLGSRLLSGNEKTISAPLGSSAGRQVELLLAPPVGTPSYLPVAAGGISLLAFILSLGIWKISAKTGAHGAPTVSPAMSGSAVKVSQIENDADLGSAGTQMRAASDAGRQIGRYTTLRKLGSGGMAEVYLAQAHGEAGFEKLVALKVLHKHIATTPLVVEHFLDEARLASRLTHPNIIQISDLGRAGDEYYIAMEYIDGSDLEQLIRECRQRGTLIPTSVALTILRKICDGLNAAHTALGPDGQPLQLVHRDVKSANVFVSRDGAIKVGDFGIAKASYAGRVAKTEIGQVKGTAAYMAPEHRTGEAVDRRADIYAVGAIAYEMLSGTEINLDLAVLLHKGREGWPHLPKLSALRPDLPTELDAVIGKALSYDKAERHETCDELEEAFGAVAAKFSMIASDKAVAQFIERELTAAGRVRSNAASS